MDKKRLKGKKADANFWVVLVLGIIFLSLLAMLLNNLGKILNAKVIG